MISEASSKKKKAVATKKTTSATSSKPKREKAKAIDGLGSVELMKLRNAMRQVWQRSKQWKLVKARCKDSEGYDVCEGCDTRVPKIFVDHIVPIGDMLDPGFIERLMVPSSELKGLCNECHKPKTKKDNAETKAKKKEKLTPPKHGYQGEPEPQIDLDILEMDIYTHEKIALQEKRNSEPEAEFSLDSFI